MRFMGNVSKYNEMLVLLRYRAARFLSCLSWLLENAAEATAFCTGPQCTGLLVSLNIIRALGRLPREDRTSESGTVDTVDGAQCMHCFPTSEPGGCASLEGLGLETLWNPPRSPLVLLPC